MSVDLDELRADCQRRIDNPELDWLTIEPAKMLAMIDRIRALEAKNAELAEIQRSGLLSDIQREALIRIEVENVRAAEEFENRVLNLRRLIEKNHKFDWPYTSAFDDGGVAYHEAQRRIEAEKQ